MACVKGVAMSPAACDRPEPVLEKLDRDVLGYASCRHLPSQFACHTRSPEAIIATLKKEDVKERCRQLGRQPTGSLSQMVMTIADAIIVRAQLLPRQFMSLNNMIAGGDAFGAPCDATRCWLCGSAVASINLGNVADLQVGSWPPGDPRRWQFGGSCVIPVLVCQGYGKPSQGGDPVWSGADIQNGPAAHASAAEESAPARRPNRPELPPDVLEMRARLYRKSSHRLPCKVGDFPTISAVFWAGRWWSLDEALTLCTGDALRDGVIPCPQEPCMERVCLQVLNWFSMSGLEKVDKNCLPARVYLTRPARLVCRAGQVVGYMTYTARANEHFPIPTLCAIYVRPEVRGKGACKALMHDFIHLSRAAKVSAASGKGGCDHTGASREEAERSAGAGAGGDIDAFDVSGADAEMYGIEEPVSMALLSALPKIFSTAMLKKFRVIQHGDSLEQVSSRRSLWQDVLKSQSA
jgi:hypothetical protein